MTDPRPLIFLDMDGVLATPRCTIADGFVRGIDPVAIKLLNKLCEAFKPLLVVSSTWRVMPKERFQGLLQGCGLKAEYHDEWKTGDEPGIRGDQVRAWLGRHPDVTRHIILDDESDFHPDQPLVLCDPYNGLHVDAYRRAEELLAGKPVSVEWLSYRCQRDEAVARAEAAEAKIEGLQRAMQDPGLRL